MSKTMDEYCKGNPRVREILEMHYAGFAPSQIDSALLLHRNEARFTISDYWLFDKLKGKH